MGEPRFTRRALSELRGQLSWLRARDPRAADRLAHDVDRVLRLLADHPRSGRPVEGTSLWVMLTPRFRYRLVYRVASEVVVVGVLHPSQGG